MSHLQISKPRMIELRTTMPARNEADIDVAVKNAPITACAGRMPISENGMAAISASVRHAASPVSARAETLAAAKAQV